MKAVYFLKASQALAVGGVALFASACASALTPTTELGDSHLYANFLRGRYASLTADNDASASYYRDALKQMPGDQEILERAITRTLIAGDVRTAAALGNGARTTGAPPPHLGMLAVTAENLARGRYKDAEASSAISSEMSPFNQVILGTLRAWARAGSGDTDGAVAMVTAMNSGTSLDRLNDYQIALIQDFAGHNDKARDSYERAWSSGLRLAVDVEAYGRLLERMGDQASAIAIYDEFLSNVGRNPVIEAALARAKTRASIPPPIASARQGAAISIFGPAAALASQSGSDQAAAYLQLALYLDPSLDAARTLIAAARSDAGKIDEAIQILEEIKQTSPYFENARIERMWALVRLDRDDEAVALARETATLTPSTKTELALADLYRALERWNDADPVYAAVIEGEKVQGIEELARVYFSRGTVRERSNRWPEAEKDLKQALSLSPSNADILNYLGYSWIDRGVHIEEALDLIKQAVSLQPESGFIVDSLGWAQFKLGRFADAVETLENAVQLAPGEATINDHLGDAYWRVGRQVEARYQWTRALSLDPTDEERASAEAKLKNGLVDPPSTTSISTSTPKQKAP